MDKEDLERWEEELKKKEIELKEKEEKLNKEKKEIYNIPNDLKKAKQIKIKLEKENKRLKEKTDKLLTEGKKELTEIENKKKSLENEIKELSAAIRTIQLGRFYKAKQGEIIAELRKGIALYERLQQKIKDAEAYLQILNKHQRIREKENFDFAIDIFPYISIEDKALLLYSLPHNELQKVFDILIQFKYQEEILGGGLKWQKKN